EEHPAENGLGPRPLRGGDPRGRGGGTRHRHIAGTLVQTHRQAAAPGAHQVNLHDHRRRPCEALADPEQHVRGKDPVPTRCPHQKERHRCGNQPSRDEHPFSPHAIGQPAREVIGQRLRHAEHDDERQDRCPSRETEFLLGDGRQNAPLHPDHPTDEGIDHDQQGELEDVLAEAETHLPVPTVDTCRRHTRVSTVVPRLNARISSISSGFGGTSANDSTNASRSRDNIGFQRRSNAMVLVGLPLRPAPQTDPEKWPGKISTSPGSVSSFSWMLVKSRAAFSRAHPGRSGRPTAPTKSVSPVNTNHGASPRFRSVTRRQMLSGEWPGVWSTFTRVLPSSTSSPSFSDVNGKVTSADSCRQYWAPAWRASSGPPERWSAWTCVSMTCVIRMRLLAANAAYASTSSVLASTTAHRPSVPQPNRYAAQPLS